MDKGFTLIELLLSIALIAFLVGLSLPVYYTLISRNSLDVAKNQAVQCFRRAEFLSSASDDDSTWGVKIQPSIIVVFKGASYSARSVSYDEIYQIDGSVAPSGLTEIVFNKFSGLPQSTGTVILTSINNETRAITINSKGRISY